MTRQKLKCTPPFFPISTKGHRFNHRRCRHRYNDVCMWNSHSYWPPNSWAACGHFVLPEEQRRLSAELPINPSGLSASARHRLLLWFSALWRLFFVVVLNPRGSTGCVLSRDTLTNRYDFFTLHAAVVHPEFRLHYFCKDRPLLAFPTFSQTIKMAVVCWQIIQKDLLMGFFKKTFVFTLQKLQVIPAEIKGHYSCENV